MTKAEVDSKITKNMSSQAFKDAVGKIVKDRIKNEPYLEDKILDITKNVITQLFKTLWIKRGVWRNNLENKSS